MSLKDKMAIVSGATGALGRVVTKSLLENGAKVVSPFRTQERQDELAEFVGPLKSGLTGIQADVANAESVRGLVKQTMQMHGRVDILLNITGGFLGGKTVAETDEKDWDFIQSVNLKSVFLVPKRFCPI
jgi:NAD(P)-dependent dehydrogenase (short-subunit alcohol dehydrogenase family)